MLVDVGIKVLNALLETQIQRNYTSPNFAWLNTGFYHFILRQCEIVGSWQ